MQKQGLETRSYPLMIALTYDLFDHFVSWNAGSARKDLYVYDASGTRVLRHTTTGSGTTMRVYAFGLEQHTSFEVDYYTALHNNTTHINLNKAILALPPFTHLTKSTPNPDDPHHSRLIQILKKQSFVGDFPA